IPGGQAALARLLRRGEIETIEITRRRARRTQKIVAWNMQISDSVNGANPSTVSKQDRVRAALIDRGPLSLPELFRIAKVSRSVVDRLAKQGSVQVWDEEVHPEISAFDANFAAPSNVLNDDQRSAVTQIVQWLESRAFTAGLIYGVTGSGKTEVYLHAVAD